MKKISQNNYMVQIRNAMLLQFKRSEISSTLEDINLYFHSGIVDNKTDEELCCELGNPKEFVRTLSDDNSYRKPKYIKTVYILSFLFLLACLFYYLYQPNLISLYCNMIVLPIIIWNLLGGDSLLQLENNTPKLQKIYIGYSVFSVIFTGIAQANIFVLDNGLMISKKINLIIFHLSNIWIVVSVSTIVFAVYMLYHGYYLSHGILIFALGVTASLRLYNTFLKSFDTPEAEYTICVMPVIISMILVLLFHIYIKQKQKGCLWIHR